MKAKKHWWVWSLATCVALTVVGLTDPKPAMAEPLTPLTPGELSYLDQAHRVLSVSRSPTAFRSDGELLTQGQFACDERRAGLVGYSATYVDPVLTQLAFIYLCPQ